MNSWKTAGLIKPFLGTKVRTEEKKRGWYRTVRNQSEQGVEFDTVDCNLCLSDLWMPNSESTLDSYCITICLYLFVLRCDMTSFAKRIDLEIYNCICYPFIWAVSYPSLECVCKILNFFTTDGRRDNVGPVSKVFPHWNVDILLKAVIPFKRQEADVARQIMLHSVTCFKKENNCTRTDLAETCFAEFSIIYNLPISSTFLNTVGKGWERANLVYRTNCPRQISELLQQRYLLPTI